MKIDFCYDLEAAKLLWTTCFPKDSPDFVQFYLERVHKAQDSLLLLGEEQDPRAYMGMVPYEMMVKGQGVNCSYLSGVCTLPAFRGRGYMTAMMERAFRVMFDRGDVLSILIPAIHELYFKYGYTDQFFLEQQPLPVGEGSGERVTSCPHMNEWYRFYCQEQFDDWLERTPQQWEIILEEHARFEDGEIWCNQGAYALVSRYGGQAVVKEAMGQEDEIQKLLCQIGEGVLLTPDSSKPFAQARIINVEKAMELLPDCFLKVTDPWIQENNGTFSVENGVVTKQEEGGQPITIERLTNQLLLGYNYLNLMLN